VNTKKVLLEFKLPKEILKSPAAMEVFMSALHIPVTGSWTDVYLSGRVKPTFSLELVSISGEVHFYIWTWEKFRATIENFLYAQYPEVEVYPVADYTEGYRYEPDTFLYYGAQFKLTKPDPYPIKTYIDYGLDKDPKEEFKIDPITPALEFLGSLRQGEYAWVQILIQPHSEEGLKQGALSFKADWKEEAAKEIETIVGEGKFSDLSETKKQTINAIERSIGKFAFNTKIRGLYFATKDQFRSENIGGLNGMVKQFSSNTLNGFKQDWQTSFNYIWQDPFGRKSRERQERLLDASRQRGAFQYPFSDIGSKPFILTTEELATLFHFPGAVAATPTLTRIPSKKSEAPSNLPI